MLEPFTGKENLPSKPENSAIANLSHPELHARLADIGNHTTKMLHDMGSGFAAINSFAGAIQILLEQPTDSETTATPLNATQAFEMAGHIINVTRTLQEFRSQILHYARGPAPDTIMGVMNISTLFKAFERNASAYFRLNNISLAATPIDKEIIADKTHLLRVLQNLTSNAAQVMSTSGGEIILSAEELPCTSPPSICIRVRDNGPGIHSSLHDSLFEPFVTGSTRTGTGLGLYIAKQIVEAHHGSITFTTSPNGTEFQIILPVNPSERSV